MQSPEARRGKWLFCLGVSVCALVLMAWPNALIDFSYDRAALEAGQWWRAFTGHMVHLSVAHVLLNLFGLFLICELLWRDLPWLHGCALLIFSAIGISGLLWSFHPELAWYGGLSGMLHGLWAGCALAGWWSTQTRGENNAARDSVIQTGLVLPRYFFMVALTMLALKVGLEAVYGPSSHTELMIGGPVISAAHFYGALTGIVYVSIWRGISGLWPRK